MSSATLATYLFGGDARTIAIVELLVIGTALTLAPVVYIALERLEFVKVAAVAALMALAIAFAIDGETWRALPEGLGRVGHVPTELGFALLLGAVAFAGAGGGQNLCQSNWIRDKGFGMGRYVPRLVSPLTGVEEMPATATSFTFPTDAANLTRWRRWWRFANAEQAITFVAVTVATICLTSMLAYSTLKGRTDLPNSVAFLQIEGRALEATVGTWFGVLFWAVGAFSLFASSLGIIDYTSRLAADVLKSAYFRGSSVSESRMYFRLVWALVGTGCAILLLGVTQPLVLLVISACVGGGMMFLYSMLLIVLNRRALPEPLRIRSYRLGVLAWSTVFFGVLAALTMWQQVRQLLR